MKLDGVLKQNMWLKILLPLLLVTDVESYKILMFSPTASKSHMISQGRIADELSRAGHKVINFEPDFLDLTDKFVPCSLCERWPVTGLHNENYKKIQNELSETVFEESSFWDHVFNTKTDPHQDEYNNLCEEIVTNDTLINKLKAENFDAYFGEHVHLCGMGLAHLLGVKHRFWIASCTMGVSMRENLGVPTPASFLPFMSHLDRTPAPIWQRAKNFILQMAQVRDEYRDNAKTTAMYRKHYGEQFPEIEHIAKTSDAVFVSTDELLEIPAPTLSNIIHIGGLGISSDEKTLEEKFLVEMGRGTGSIFFSLGTIANTTNLPTRVMENIFRIAQKFKEYNFIVKVDKQDQNSFKLGSNIENVLVVDWAPQAALLKHPNLKAFITHGGYNSLMESAWEGVPVISIPFMFDQPRNGRAVERKGWGVLVDKRSLLNDPDSIERALEEILFNPKYREKAQRLKKLMRSKPQSAAERLVKTTEWILKNNGIEELQYEGKFLDSLTFYNIDLLLLFLAVPIILFISLRISDFKVNFRSKSKKE